MSAHYEITCDWCADDGTGTHFRAIPKLQVGKGVHEQLTALRALAAKHGWSKVGLRDACKHHTYLVEKEARGGR